ncbi:MAG: hypothetical protein H2057_02975 [Alphaproteobacteria bacterium]|nr:hypothetical protein [Alphaproteobacteria bacterium]
MSMTLSRNKGSPLTFEELDQNFEELDKKVKHLEETSLPGEGLKEIIQEGDELIFESTFGRNLGRARLPMPLFHHKGVWKAQTSYVYGSLVTWQNKVYCCHTSHVSEEILSEHMWSLLLQVPETEKQVIATSSAEAAQTLPLLPLYDKEVLPEPAMGKLCLMTDSTGLFVLIGGCDKWHTFQKLA